jgi:hypothetical protein
VQSRARGAPDACYGIHASIRQNEGHSADAEGRVCDDAITCKNEGIRTTILNTCIKVLLSSCHCTGHPMHYVKLGRVKGGLLHSNTHTELTKQTQQQCKQKCHFASECFSDSSPPYAYRYAGLVPSSLTSLRCTMNMGIFTFPSLLGTNTCVQKFSGQHTLSDLCIRCFAAGFSCPACMLGSEEHRIGQLGGLPWKASFAGCLSVNFPLIAHAWGLTFRATYMARLEASRVQRVP